MHSPWSNDCLMNRNAKSNIFYLRSVVTQAKPTDAMTTSQPNQVILLILMKRD